MKKENSTGRAFICIGLNETFNGEWREHFIIGQTYFEAKHDSDGNNLITPVDKTLLLEGRFEIAIYCDSMEFALLLDASQFLTNLIRKL